MKTSDFSKYITDFLTTYLIDERGFSKNTVFSYRDAFIQFINYLTQIEKIKIAKITLASITQDRVVSFLDWLQVEKGVAASTRNNRLAAIHSFVKYVQYRHPDHLFEFQRVLSIRSKRQVRGSVTHLSLDGVKQFLSMPNTKTAKGRRDLAILSMLYDTGARVQEIVDLCVQDVHIDKPYYVTLRGKGAKIRTVPMTDDQMIILLSYIDENGLRKSECRPHPLFANNRGEKLTRGGVTYIVKRYAAMAREVDVTLIPDNFSCHSLRHSKAMHLLQAGVNLVYIRDILGHVSIQTTEVYARADSKQKREAIVKAYNKVAPDIKPQWEENGDILNWLKSF